MALYGIKRIQYCKATQLAFSGQNNPFLGIASEPTNTFTDIVCLVNSRATLTIEQTVQNKQIVYTAKLQFVTPADPALDVDHYAFIATTNDGERILLGANTRPQVAVVTAQGIYGTSGELTAYTTTAEFKANYRPLRLPVSAAEPVSGPAYDICCGEIVGSPTMLTVIWQNYNGTEVDRATYPEGSPEPTTSVVPTRPATSEYTYTFNGWSLYSQTATTKIYRAQYNQVPITQTLTVIWQNYDGTEVDRATYSEGSAEPTTSLVPTKPDDIFNTYTFNNWSLYSQTDTTKIYRAQYASTAIDYTHQQPTGIGVDSLNLTIDGSQVNSNPLIGFVNSIDNIVFFKCEGAISILDGEIQNNTLSMDIATPKNYIDLHQYENPDVPNDSVYDALTNQSFKNFSTQTYDYIEKNAGVAKGVKPKNSETLDLSDCWQSSLIVADNTESNDKIYKAWLFVSFDGQNVIKTKIYFTNGMWYSGNPEGMFNSNIYLKQQPKLFKIVAYNRLDYHYNASIGTAIKNSAGKTIGFYTNDYTGPL